MTTSVGNNSVFKSFFEKQKLTGTNFIDWYRQLCLVLLTEDKENYLEHPIPAAPVAPPRQQVPLHALVAHAAWVKGQKEELKAMYSKQVKQELLQTVGEFHTSKQEEGQLVSSHVLKMKGYIDNLDMRKTVIEIHAMLKLHEETLPKKDANPALHAIRIGRFQKNQKNKPHKDAKGGHGKGKGKMGYALKNAPFSPKPKTPPPPKKGNPAKDAICHQCGEFGHWRRNYPVYHVELMKKKKLSQGASTSGSKKLKPGALSLYVGDGHRAAVETIGTYYLELPSGLVIVLNNCHYAPSITRGVILVSRLFDDGFINRFDDNNLILVSKNNLVCFMAVPRDGIFEIDMSCSNTNDSSIYAITNKRAKINLDYSLLWHCRLGHVSKKRIEKLQHDGFLNSIGIESLGKYVSCMSGKMARKPNSHQVERAKDLLGLIHTDANQELLQIVWEFHACKQEEGQSVSSYVLKVKSYIDNLERLSYAMTQNLSVSLIMVLLRKEYDGFVQNYNMHSMRKTVNELHAMLRLHEQTLPPKEGLRESRKLKPGALSLYVGDGHRAAIEAIGDYHVAKFNLDSTLLWHCYLGQINKKCIEKLQHDELLDSTDIKSFEKCVACMSGKMARKPYSHQVERAKYLLGLIHTDMARKPYSHQVERAKDLLGLIHTDVCGPFKIVSRQEVFQKEVENQLEKTIKSLCFDPGDTSLNHEEDDQEIYEPQSDINPIHKSSRTHRAPDHMFLYIDVEEHELGDLDEPANYKAALLNPESKKWLDAMNVNMQSMKDNDVWVLVELPPNARTVGSKWLFKKKTSMDDIRAIRILIAIAMYYDYEIWQIDVKTAFLNGHLSDEVYMEQPEGFVNPKYPNHVCKHKRSIYELKQASRQCNKRFDDEIKKFGFTQNPDEPCVYLKASRSYIAILILYVDDILLMGNNIPMLQDVKSYLGRSFAMKHLGEAAYILGIKIYHDRSKRLISLCQKAYIENILKRYYMENSKRRTIPTQEKLKLSKSQGASTPAEKQRMQNIPYASVVGSIMYAMRCTRPDVAFAQNMTSRFQQNPSEEHWTAVKNILKYLCNTKDMFMVYGGNMERELRVSCYTDVGYLTDADNLKSQIGYVFVLNGEPISMYCDNIGAVAIAKDDGVTKGARHFRAKVCYLRETINLGDVKIVKIDTYDNLADPFTKALAFSKHSELTRNI
uniref:Retrotransposon protein, putative, Ty1-copia subclass n=1 Tax=Tanacetum cinerariifolium TaxID=118510 RepID=A0A6L2LZ99_TANCI|nr:hypothetical protein [Tanacetum cinerariifolium]